MRHVDWLLIFFFKWGRLSAKFNCTRYEEHIWTFHQISPKGHCAFIVCYPIFKRPFELWSWNLIHSFLLITWKNHVKFDISAARSAKEQPKNSQNWLLPPHPTPERPSGWHDWKHRRSLIPTSASKHCIQSLCKDMRFKCQEHAGDAQLYPSFLMHNFTAEVTWSEISPWQRIPGWHKTWIRQEFCW